MYGLLMLVGFAILPTSTPFIPTVAFYDLWRRNALSMPRLPRSVFINLLALATMLLLAASFKGAAQWTLCLASLVICARFTQLHIDHRLVSILGVFFGACLVMLFLDALGGLPNVFAERFFTPGEFGERRFRFLMSEPNQLIVHLYFLVIVLHEEIRRSGLLTRILINLGIVVVAVATGSPLGYFGVVLHLWSFIATGSLRTRIAALIAAGILALMLVQIMPASLSSRIDLILAGEDNSLNLRTWGSVSIAITTLIDSGRGLFGTGLGSARNVLEGNPYLIFFAAEDQSVLPSFIANAMLEIGYVGLAVIVLLWAQVLFFARRHSNLLLATTFVILDCCSGSFLFNTFSWSALGFTLGCAVRRPLSAKIEAQTPGWPAVQPLS